MSDQNEKRERGPKRPYEPPAISETAEFETLALSCDKFDSSGIPDCTASHGIAGAS